MKWLILIDKLFDWLEISTQFVAEKIRVGLYFEKSVSFSWVIIEETYSNFQIFLGYELD